MPNALAASRQGFRLILSPVLAARHLPPAAHKLTLDPLRLAYSLLRPVASTLKVLPLRARQPDSVYPSPLKERYEARDGYASLFQPRIRPAGAS